MQILQFILIVSKKGKKQNNKITTELSEIKGKIELTQ